MTKNKQQTAVEWLQSIELERDLTLADWKQAKEMENKQTEMYKECLEQFVPIEKWDDATKFLSTHGSGLAKDFSKNETYGGGEQ